MLKVKVGRFLEIYAAFTQPISAYVPQGINESNIAYTRAIVPSNMSPGDTLSITTPPGQDPGLIPSEYWFPTVYPVLGVNGTPTGPQNYGAPLIMVSHDTTLGITKLSSPSGITAGAEVLLEFIGGE